MVLTNQILRNPLEIIDVSDVFKETSFRPFRDSIVRAIKVDDIASKTKTAGLTK